MFSAFCVFLTSLEAIRNIGKTHWERYFVRKKKFSKKLESTAHFSNLRLFCQIYSFSWKSSGNVGRGLCSRMCITYPLHHEDQDNILSLKADSQAIQAVTPVVTISEMTYYAGLWKAY